MKMVLLASLVILGLAVSWLMKPSDKVPELQVVPDKTVRPSPTIEAVEQSEVTQVAKVVYGETGFAPKELEIEKGTTVTFLNQTGKPMWVGSDPHPAHTDYPKFDQLGSSDEYVYTFTEIGRYSYHNHLAPRDTGVVVVK